MWNLIKEYRQYCLAALLIILPLLALNASDKKPSNYYWFDSLALRITTPLQTVLTRSLEGAWSATQNYLFLLDVRSINQELLVETRQLLNEIASYREISLENKRLRELVQFSQNIRGKKIAAKVIAEDVMPEFRTIRIDKGTSSGIHRGMAVVTPEGIVGRVIRVEKEFADVLTLMDSSSNVAAMIQRNRSRGVVEGYTGSILQLKYIRRTAEVKEGDIVISSGIGTLFPKGIVIGRVTKVEKKDYGITQTVKLVPSVDFSRLEEVLVVKPEAKVESVSTVAEEQKDSGS